MPVDSTRSLIDDLETGPSDRLIERALARLAAGAELSLLLATVKAMVRNGVPGLGAALLQSVRGDAGPELEKLGADLRAMPSGELPRGARSARFDANVAALCARRPSIEQHLPSFDEVDGRLAVYRTAEDNDQVAHCTGMGPLRLALRYADHRGEARGLPMPEIGFGTSFLLIGVPSIPALERLYSTRTAAGYEPAIDLVETDAMVLGVWLTLADLGAVLRDDRVALFAGAGAVEDYLAFLIADADRQPASHRLTMPRPGWQPPRIDDAVMEPVRRDVERRREAAVARQVDLYGGTDAAFWADRYRRAGDDEPPLRVLGFTTRFSTVVQHAMRDLGGAFRRAGCAFDLCIERHPWCGGVNPLAALAERRYDLVVVVNHLRHESAGQIHERVPHACWIQDHMPSLWSPQAGASVGPYDLVLGHGPRELFEVHGYPRDRFLPTTNLTDPVTYHDGPVPATDLERVACDLSYVSHGAEPPRRMVEQMTEGGDPALRRYLMRIIDLLEERLSRKRWIDTVEQAELVLQAEAESGHRALTPAERRAVVVPAAGRLLDRIFRHQTLAWAARWAESRGKRLRIYGRGWDRHELLAPYAAGEVENGEPLRRVYRASTVNLQVNVYGSMHQRLLDGVASGGFMLTRYNPADLRSEPHRRVAETIRRDRVRDLAALLELAERRPALRQQLDRITELTGARIARADDPVRLAQKRCMQPVFDLPDDLFTDAGLFELLATMRHLPRRAAGDLDGFEETIFDGPESMEAAMDRFIDEPDARAAVVGRMRRDVLEHDTFDALVRSLLDRFERLFREQAWREADPAAAMGVAAPAAPCGGETP